MGQYLPVFALFVLGLLFALLSLIASALLNKRQPNAAKQAPYECGIVPSREAPERFPVSFYLVAMLFIMFDIEVIFLYPYAIARNELGAFGLWEIVTFSVIFFLAFVYVVAQRRAGLGPDREGSAADVGNLAGTHNGLHRSASRSRRSQRAEAA